MVHVQFHSIVLPFLIAKTINMPEDLVKSCRCLDVFGTSCVGLVSTSSLDIVHSSRALPHLTLCRPLGYDLAGGTQKTSSAPVRNSTSNRLSHEKICVCKKNRKVTCNILVRSFKLQRAKGNFQLHRDGAENPQLVSLVTACPSSKLHLSC